MPPATTIDRMAIRPLTVVALVFAIGGGLTIVPGEQSAATIPASTSQVPPGPALVCKLPPRSKKLPATARRGLIQHLVQYPDVRLATPLQRARAERVLAQLASAAREGNWRDLQAVAAAGYNVRTAIRKAGDLSVHYFHAERRQEPHGRAILNPRRPKALIYANAPGQSLVLVGAMWSTRRDERGPTPGGSITRWHKHVICARGLSRGTKPPASGRCPPGTQLRQARSEMLHVWFTRDLRSAFAIRAPEPELCAAGLLPMRYCQRVRQRPNR